MVKEKGATSQEVRDPFPACLKAGNLLVEYVNFTLYLKFSALKWLNVVSSKFYAKPLLNMLEILEFYDVMSWMLKIVEQ